MCSVEVACAERVLAFRCDAGEAQAWLNIINQHKLQDQGSIEIYDVSGALVFAEKMVFTGKSFVVDTKNLPAGSYMLQWTTSKGSTTRPFIKS